MMSIHEQANAKINLILDVTGKRPDGYHELRTVFQSLKLADTVTFTENPTRDITLSCNLPDLPAGEENLAWRAARLLQETYHVAQGVHIVLDKRIPVAAGLGGGSSNAAAVLRGLIRFWGLPHEPDVLHALASRLGSDVPFCLVGGTALGTGRGEHLVDLPPCPPFYVVLANPGFPVSTARVYGHLSQVRADASPDVDGLVEAVGLWDREGIAARLANVLEYATFPLYPAVRELKERMVQSGPSLMCGSGATVFSLFSEPGEAAALHQTLRAEGTASWLTETENDLREEDRHV